MNAESICRMRALSGGAPSTGIMRCRSSLWFPRWKCPCMWLSTGTGMSCLWAAIHSRMHSRPTPCRLLSRFPLRIRSRLPRPSRSRFSRQCLNRIRSRLRSPISATFCRKAVFRISAAMTGCSGQIRCRIRRIPAFRLRPILSRPGRPRLRQETGNGRPVPAAFSAESPRPERFRI